MKKIVTIIGARPQFVKAAIVSRALQQATDLQEVLVHTGQHYDANMSSMFFAELEMPAINYQLATGSGSHAQQTGVMLVAIEEVLIKEKPEVLLIYGDTNSTLAGALAAAKLHIPIAHVEAGLRSFNRKMPEEINRIVADQLAHILFTPTKQAVTNLQKEGFAAERIITVGDVMYDAALYYGHKAKQHSAILNKLAVREQQYILTTIHRAENTDDSHKLYTIFTALTHIAHSMPVVMPLHPRTRKALSSQHPQLLKNSAIHFIEPVGFLDMMMLEKHAALIITDSGGVQKEAFYYQVPCITLRDETEWLETVDLGWNHVVPPTDPKTIAQQVLQAIGTQGTRDQHPYGKGNAAQLITKYLQQGTC